MAENRQEEHLEVASDTIPPEHTPNDLPDEPPSIASRRPLRKKRLTWKLLDRLPAPPSDSIPDLPISETRELIAASAPDQCQPSYVWKTVHTIRNTFGMYREYPKIPTYNPDDILTLANLTEYNKAPELEEETPRPPPAIIQAIQQIPITSNSEHKTRNMYAPFANSSIHGIMDWMWSGSAMKSLEEVSKLIGFLKSADFRKEDIEGFNIRRETALFDLALGSQPNSQTTTAQDNPSAPVYNEGWHEVEVKIQVPDGLTHTDDADIPLFSVPGLHYRSICSVIKSTFEDASSSCFHYTPFKLFWKPTADSAPQRIHDEIYSSDAMVKAHEDLQNRPPESGCNLERVVASLMFWSDSTHLASFGNASLWPIYLFFGNQSKWLRGKPRCGACHHVAYIPKVILTCYNFIPR
jgi:Plavaka transposase